jgi:hypothetical protein
MSDTSQGQGWWLATDGKWYPPEAWTGPPPQIGQTSGQPGQFPNPSTQSPYPSPQEPYQPGPVTHPTNQVPYPFSGPMPQGNMWATPPPKNGLAIASLVCSCAGVIPFLFGVPCILGIIFGFVARSQIKRSNRTLGGEGLALAGIIVGFGLIGIFIIFVVLLAIFGHAQNCSGNSIRFDCRTN